MPQLGGLYGKRGWPKTMQPALYHNRENRAARELVQRQTFQLIEPGFSVNPTVTTSRSTTEPHLNSNAAYAEAAADTPVLAFNPDGTFKGLQCFGAYTNQQLDSADWDRMDSSGGNLVRTEGVAFLHSSTNLGKLFTPDGTGGGNWIGGGVGLDNSNGYKRSMQTKIKRNGTNNAANQWFILGYRESGGFSHRHGVIIDLENLEVYKYEAGDSVIDEVELIPLGDDEYLVLCHGMYLPSATDTAVVFESGFGSDSTSWINSSAIGDGTNGIIVADFQSEHKNFCSPFYVTDGTALTKNHSENAFDITPFYPGEDIGCVVYIEAQRDYAVNDSDSHVIFEARGAGDDNDNRVTLRLLTNGNLSLQVLHDGNYYADMGGGTAFPLKQLNKLAVVLQKDRVELYLNGTRVGADTNVQAVPDIVNGYIGNPSWTGWAFDGWIPQLKVTRGVGERGYLEGLTSL